ncbi:S9 family peptidase [Zobellia galactanivorans]|uniref:Dipeptidyl-peptidase IV, family S9 n=1 Tax=Zobellia galactanivorans (strain DSM 12802 / CCUG 47099 / CIP 106680 / NCIMB 13871 / Dsij) TaxID=63186 RepID=G0L363_ZOBGA|nr:S9 family peptidase [Zobellia galactanivorans]MDO6808556.1 S9 family peptidase [Zobellia galactanivorans]CAZ95247.1 Dipeptidyl-peptidase IV, family S9 [Zobellia galactanivorans]
MQKLVLSVSFVFAFLAFSYAQEKQVITVEAVYGGEFSIERLDVLRSMKNGKQYTILNRGANGATTIDKFDYASQKKVETIVSSADLSGIDGFSSYQFSDDESQVLLATELESIFRRSTLGVFYVYDLKSKKLTKVSDTKIQEPKLSPDGTKVAYVSKNNLYLFDLLSGNTKQLTTDGEKNKIINGVTDWVYEEEFAFVRAFDWNTDGSKIAFLRFDESEVPEFSMDVFGTDLYPSQETFKYPKAGEANAKVSLHLYDVKSGSTAAVDLNDPYYIPRIKWMNNPNYLSVQTLNRHQNDLKLYSVNAKNNTASVLLEEKDKAYVDITDNLTFLADDSFIWTSEKDGYNHIYLHDQDGRLVNQITKGPWEVTRYYGYDQKEDKVYYQSTENGSINRGVYSIESNGKKKKALAVEAGTNSADFSADFTYFIHTYSNAKTPPVYTLRKALSGKEVKEIKNNEALMTKLKAYELSEKEFSTININGNELNMYMVKPKDFDPSKKYPLLMYQYSGPGSQSVSNSWLDARDLWHQQLASQGYVVACVDGRGTGFKGADFKKSTYLNLVKYETEDQIAAARELSKLPYIDEDRTGIWGWSFGGHMATNCILKGNDVFETAIAVAPVTTWRFYDTIYTERFLRTPAENPAGYDENSPLNYPEMLKGDFLLVHGSGDDNVHVQNSMRMIEALVQANKQFDWAIYPDKNHGIYGGNTRVHLFNKMTNFLGEHLLHPKK